MRRQPESQFQSFAVTMNNECTYSKARSSSSSMDSRCDDDDKPCRHLSSSTTAPRFCFMNSNSHNHVYVFFLLYNRRWCIITGCFLLTVYSMGMAYQRYNNNNKTNIIILASAWNEFPPDASNIAAMKKTNQEMDQIFNNEHHIITLKDLKDLDWTMEPPYGTTSVSNDTITWEEAAQDRQPILDILQRAGLKVDVHVLQRLPTWSQVVRLYGDSPVMVGTETCASFRQTVPAHTRYVGVAGQMNTGTNALSKYLINNIHIPENKNNKDHGVLWTVPWYKHGWVSLRGRYEYKPPQDTSLVMPVVLIRDPYFWMQSMCESPYTLEWNKSKTHCPNLIEMSVDDVGDGDNNVEAAGVPVRLRWGLFIRVWPSLAHLWSSWYREYVKTNIPRLIIRFEDLLFHTEAVMDGIRECVGAQWKNGGTFVYQTAPAKTHPYFSRFKAPSSLISAMIKYGQDPEGQRRTHSMTMDDMAFAERFLDPELLDMFHYQKYPKGDGQSKY